MTVFSALLEFDNLELCGCWCWWFDNKAFVGGDDKFIWWAEEHSHANDLAEQGDGDGDNGDEYGDGDGDKHGDAGDYL